MKLPTKKKGIETDLNEYIYLIYGQPGAGKSTFASKFNNAIYLATEPGLKFLDCYQFENDKGEPAIIGSWIDLCQSLKQLTTQEHQFKTLIVDTVDQAFYLCREHVKQVNNIKHESELEWGKGWALISEEFERVFKKITSQGMGLVFISHEDIGEKEERGVKHTWIDNTLPKRPKKFINGLVDFIFYCQLDDDENRTMRVRSSKNINAKDRTGYLPAEMPLDYNEFKKQLTQALQAKQNEGK